MIEIVRELPIELSSRRSNRRHPNRPAASSAAPPFNGNFASLFPGAFQSVQTDLGLTYGGILLASGSAPPAVGLSGATSAVAKPIKITTTAGAVGVASYTLYLDGGTTPAQTGTTAASVAITNLPGLSVTFPTGPYVGDEIYLATCSALADQSGNAKDYSQATASLQPVITPGVNGFLGLLFDGVDDFLNSSLVLPAPGVTPGCFFAVGRQVSWAANKFVLANSAAGVNGGYQFRSNGVTPQLQILSSAGGTLSGTLAVGTFGAITGQFGNAASDYIRAGSGAAATGSAGSAASTGMNIGGRSTQFSNFEFLALVFAPGAVPETAVRASVTAKYGASVNV